MLWIGKDEKNKRETVCDSELSGLEGNDSFLPNNV